MSGREYRPPREFEFRHAGRGEPMSTPRSERDIDRGVTEARRLDEAIEARRGRRADPDALSIWTRFTRALAGKLFKR